MSFWKWIIQIQMCLSRRKLFHNLNSFHSIKQYKLCGTYIVSFQLNSYLTAQRRLFILLAKYHQQQIWGNHCSTVSQPIVCFSCCCWWWWRGGGADENQIRWLRSVINPFKDTVKLLLKIKTCVLERCFDKIKLLCSVLLGVWSW